MKLHIYLIHYLDLAWLKKAEKDGWNDAILKLLYIISGENI